MSLLDFTYSQFTALTVPKNKNRNLSVDPEITCLFALAESSECKNNRLLSK